MGKLVRPKEHGSSIHIRGREPILSPMSEESFKTLLQAHPEIEPLFETYEEVPVVVPAKSESVD